ncbi:hypothetical protein [Streptomyces sp. NPDC002276]
MRLYPRASARGVGPSAVSMTVRAAGVRCTASTGRTRDHPDSGPRAASRLARDRTDSDPRAASRLARDRTDSGP